MFASKRGWVRTVVPSIRVPWIRRDRSASRTHLVMVATASHWPVVAVRAARLGLVSRPASQREQAHHGGEGGTGVQRPAIAGVGVLLNVVVPKVRVGHGARAGTGSRYSTAVRATVRCATTRMASAGTVDGIAAVRFSPR